MSSAAEFKKMFNITGSIIMSILEINKNFNQKNLPQLLLLKPKAQGFQLLKSISKLIYLLKQIHILNYFQIFILFFYRSLMVPKT